MVNGDLYVWGPYQHLPLAVSDYVFSQNMTGIAPFLGMLEVRPHRSLVHHVCSHLMGGILAAEQHARLAYSCTTFESAVENVMLVCQVLRISYR